MAMRRYHFVILICVFLMNTDVEHGSKGFHQKVSTIWEVSTPGRRDVVSVWGSGLMARPLKSHCPIQWISWLDRGPSAYSHRYATGYPYKEEWRWGSTIAVLVGS